MRRELLVVFLLSACSGDRGPLVVDVEPDTEIDDGKADGDEPKVELKVTLDPDAIDDALELFQLAAADAEARDVHFYDSLRLDLFEVGIVLRARKIAGRDDDSTAKIRPLDPAEVDPFWFGLEDFKCETDRMPDRSVDSCSLSDRQASGEIDAVRRGERAIATLFDDQQQAFLLFYGVVEVDLEALDPLGPIPTLVWKITTPRLESKLTAELWTLPDDRRILELSTKVGRGDADDALEDLLALLGDQGLAVGDAQETKTRLALEALAAQASQD